MWRPAEPVRSIPEPDRLEKSSVVHMLNNQEHLEELCYDRMFTRSQMSNGVSQTSLLHFGDKCAETTRLRHLSPNNLGTHCS